MANSVHPGSNLQQPLGLGPSRGLKLVIKPIKI